MINQNELAALNLSYSTNLGAIYNGYFEKFIKSEIFEENQKKVDLILTSPPFPLNRAKKYGNRTGEQYIKWLSGFSFAFRDLLSEKGSIVIEIGNAWEPDRPVMSTLPTLSLLRFLTKGRFNLCEQFVCFNPARLPGPTQWVNVERIRVKDSFTHAWWMSKTTRPKANNREVLEEYSESMLKLLRSRKYNSGKRPSEHDIGKKSFLTDNGGAIPSNVLVISNTESNSSYLRYCRENGLDPHPARMSEKFANFFIKFLTDPGDLVMDPFAGSNTVGGVAEKLNRRWISIEPDKVYIKGSVGRFSTENLVIQYI